MSKIKLLTIVGARPQFIKAAAFSHAIIDNPELGITEVILHTGQHFDDNMSQIFFDELNIPTPHYRFNINNASHGQMTGQMLIEIEQVILKEQPQAVVVFGDTNSTLAGALTAAKLHIPVIHIEAGLRSFNKKMPEELNRILTDHISDLLFCPSQQAVDHLNNEHITENIHCVGDIMYDMIRLVKTNNLVTPDELNKLDYQEKSYLVLTLHRAENTDDIGKLKALLTYVKDFAQSNHLKVVFPIHPRTEKLCQTHNIDLTSFELHKPFGYVQMQTLSHYAAYIFTDSGGLQKEAYFHRVPCVTLREETEWTETIDAGWNRLWQNNDYKARREISEYNPSENISLAILTIIKQYIEAKA